MRRTKKIQLLASTRDSTQFDATSKVADLIGKQCTLDTAGIQCSLGVPQVEANSRSDQTADAACGIPGLAGARSSNEDGELSTKPQSPTSSGSASSKKNSPLPKTN